MQLARTYQLVTPVSEAVVLENQKQFKEAGLKPASANDMPGVEGVTPVPEPGTWVLLIIGLIMLAVMQRRKRGFQN